MLGHRAEYVTFAWMTWELTRDPLHLGYLGLAQGTPLVLFQLLAGVLADRTSRRRLLLVTTTLTSLTLILAFGLIVLGLARVPHLLVLAALSSTFRAFDEPSRMSLVPQLIDRERLPNAIALGSIPLSESSEIRSPWRMPSRARKSTNRRVSASNSPNVIRDP